MRNGCRGWAVLYWPFYADTFRRSVDRTQLSSLTFMFDLLQNNQLHITIFMTFAADFPLASHLISQTIQPSTSSPAFRTAHVFSRHDVSAKCKAYFSAALVRTLYHCTVDVTTQHTGLQCVQPTAYSTHHNCNLPHIFHMA
jgi:hypothetical protein